MGPWRQRRPCGVTTTCWSQTLVRGLASPQATQAGAFIHLTGIMVADIDLLRLITSHCCLCRSATELMLSTPRLVLSHVAPFSWLLLSAPLDLESATIRSCTTPSQLNAAMEAWELAYALGWSEPTLYPCSSLCQPQANSIPPSSVVAGIPGLPPEISEGPEADRQECLARDRRAADRRQLLLPQARLSGLLTAAAATFPCPLHAAVRHLA